MSQSDFLTVLNSSQRRAVEHYCGALLVVAGAGSGKTRALTYRIANLILTHRVDPENILAVTFTNKAAREMKERVEILFAQQYCLQKFSKPFSALSPQEQTQVKSLIYKTYIKRLWVGTFHSLLGKILRFDIEKYVDEGGRTWQKNFSIFDDSDCQGAIKQIVTKMMNLDDKKFEPRAVRYAISNAKNLSQSPAEYARANNDYRGRVIAEVYEKYQDFLSQNNALDFDDLLLVPVRLFQQNAQVLAYWSQKFRHILVDEYQDTNRTQYQLIQLLTTNGIDSKVFSDWQNRSTFVVGDADQCLPPGTMISTPAGDRPIEQLTIGDAVLASNGSDRTQISIITHIHHSKFQGKMWCIRSKGKVLKGTPHHLLLARVIPLENRYYVYLMYRADRGYRVGITTGLRKNGYGKSEIGFKVRVNQEHADKLWVLKAIDSYEEAVYYEAYFAAQYGLPTMMFHTQGRPGRITDETVFRLFQEIDTIGNAQRLMTELWLHPDFPHDRPQSGQHRQTLNLTMFGNIRRELSPATRADHRLQWSSNREDIAHQLTEAGLPIRPGKLPGTYRYETARKSYREAVEMAHHLANSGGLEIRRRAQIEGTIYDFMPLSHLHAGMKILLEVDGLLQEVDVDEVWQEQYNGDVYDLEVDKCHTYVANGVLVHNSIYSFRMADFTILMNFQTDFGDGLEDDDTRTMVKLEENYRSTENILAVANELIQNNTQRIDKVLKPTRASGEPIYLYQADNELMEADFVINKIQDQIRENPDLGYEDFAVLYRTNAQSRPIEDVFVKSRVPYKIVGGLKFYDRKEIKDVVAYLRVVNNPDDTVSLLRTINMPRRGVGQSTLDNLQNAAQQMGVPLWEIVNDETSVKTLAGRAYKGVLQYVELINKWRRAAGEVPEAPEEGNRSAVEILQGILNDSGYVQDLLTQGTEEATERLQNVQELVNAATQYQEDTDEPSLENFLSTTALNSDLDSLDENKAVTLMTLHSSKGLEFPIVFLVGLEEGLFPNFRSLNDPAALEEERRLCYVGITRAQEVLYISYARERRLYGRREPAIASQFLGELPQELLQSNLKKTIRRQVAMPKAEKTDPPAPAQQWSVGEQVLHGKFGVGEVTHVFGAEGKVSLAVKFEGIATKKVLDPQAVGLRKFDRQ
jgi:DNA helicase II / ATP-dependent DNA helicase PcrA